MLVKNTFPHNTLLAVLFRLGRLGHNNNEMCNKPEAVKLPENTHALSCFCGTDCSVVLTHHNKVLACGGNRYGNLSV